MMNKFFALIGIFLALICFSSMATAEITNYTVPDKIPLNRYLTFYGITDTATQLCSFFVFDMVDGNYTIVRLSDEYSNALGQFYAEIQVTEPLFKRGFDYNAVTVCGSSIASQTFYVEQKEDLFMGVSADMVLTDVAFWTDGKNSLTVVLVGFFLLIGAFLLYSVFQDLNSK